MLLIFLLLDSLFFWTALALAERKRRRDEEARQAAEAAKKAAARNAAEQAQRVQNWLQSKALLEAQLREAEKAGASQEQIAALRQLAQTKGLGAALSGAADALRAAQSTSQARGQWIEQQEAADAAFLQQMQAEQERRDAEAQARQQAWESYRAGERASYEPTAQPKSLWQRAGEWITTIVQNGVNAVSNVATGALSSQTAGSYRLSMYAKDNPPPPDSTLWDKVKEWWRVQTLKLDHPPYPLPDAGSGKHGSRRPAWADFAFEKVLQAGAVKFQLQGYDDAARHMSHYLGNSGRELKVNVDEMITEMPQFKSAVQATLESTLKKNLSAIPLSQGVESNFETGWVNFYAYPDVSPNWFYAMGGYYYWVGANAKVISAPAGENNALIKVVYRIAVSDYYNWDAGKATTFPKPEGIKIPTLPETYEGKIVDLGDTLLIYDTALAELHKAGIAQEYHIAGETAKKVIYYEYNTATSELIPVNP